MLTVFCCIFYVIFIWHRKKKYLEPTSTSRSDERDCRKLNRKILYISFEPFHFTSSNSTVGVLLGGYSKPQQHSAVFHVVFQKRKKKLKEKEPSRSSKVFTLIYSVRIAIAEDDCWQQREHLSRRTSSSTVLVVWICCLYRFGKSSR